MKIADPRTDPEMLLPCWRSRLMPKRYGASAADELAIAVYRRLREE